MNVIAVQSTNRVNNYFLLTTLVGFSSVFHVNTEALERMLLRKACVCTVSCKSALLCGRRLVCGQSEMVVTGTQLFNVLRVPAGTILQESGKGCCQKTSEYFLLGDA